MALVIPRNQPISFESANSSYKFKAITNATNTVANPYFQGADAWQVFEGTVEAELPGNLKLASDGNKIRISQVVTLCAGDHHGSIRYHAEDAAVDLDLNIGGLFNLNIGSPTSEPTGQVFDFTVPSDGDYLVEIEGTYASDGLILYLQQLLIYDDTDADVISFQVAMRDGGSNLLPDAIAFNYTPEITIDEPALKSISGIYGGEVEDLQFVFFEPGQPITRLGKYKLSMYFDYFNLSISSCTLSGSITENKARGNYTFISSTPQINFCFDRQTEVDGNENYESDSQIATLQPGDWILLSLYATAVESLILYLIDVEWSDAHLDVLPLFEDETVVLEEAYYRLKFENEIAEPVNIKVYRVSTGALVFEDESITGSYDRIIRIANAGDYRFVFTVDDVVEDFELTDVSLKKQSYPASYMVDEDDNNILTITGIPVYLPALTGNYHIENVLFNFPLNGIPNGCYRIKVYDETGLSSTVYTSNIFQLGRSFPDLLKFDWTNSANIVSGADHINWAELTAYAPFMRLNAEIVNPTNDDDLESYEFDTGFVQKLFEKQRTSRILQLLDSQPEFVLLALAMALMSEYVYIDDVQYQKIEEEDFEPNWPAKGDQTAPVRVLMHRVGEHYVNSL